MRFVCVKTFIRVKGTVARPDVPVHVYVRTYESTYVKSAVESAAEANEDDRQCPLPQTRATACAASTFGGG
jgi:hypothetical protein